MGKSPERPCWHGGIYNTNTSDCICYHGYIGKWCHKLMEDCSEGWTLPYYNKEKTVFSIHPTTSPYPFKVFCEMVHKGKLTILRITPDAPYVDFNRTFTEYKDGFGDLEGNLWLGLEKFYYLTNHRNMVLKVVVKTNGYEKQTSFRQRFYNDFKLSSESDGYRFNFSSHETKPGEAALGDCLTEVKGLPFSTIDNDRDTKVGNCAKTHLSGWWYKNCGPCNPTGKLQPTSELTQTTDPIYVRMTIDGDLPALESPERPCFHGGTYNPTTSDCICYHGYIGSRCHKLMQDCSEGFDQPYYVEMDAMVPVHPRSSPYPIKVYCEMRHGGKLVILRRTFKAPEVDFNRTFAEYKDGFGDLEGNAWFGLQKLHHLTSHRNMTLQITVKARTDTGKPEFRKRFYIGFQLLNESDGYSFTFLSQKPDPVWPLGDCLATAVGQPFSTIDNDKDTDVGNCAMIHLSGWWFQNCGMCNPTGKLQPKSELTQNADPTYVNMPIDGNKAALEVKMYLTYFG
ncbi:uncharacterized protein LOC124292442 [Haliotis rubra]|uniref:uncharacterized protein LOC124292442 n=1 Tax=Haliotis rubra TaxID=36100 RepID=UPI001EE51A0D|nr:uncharacterized protein LOC124292442 [Haliotis rubra]